MRHKINTSFVVCVMLVMMMIFQLGETAVAAASDDEECETTSFIFIQ